MEYLPIVLFASFLFLLIRHVAISYDRKKQRILDSREAISTSIVTPDSMSRDQLRNYTVRYTKNKEIFELTLSARNYLDAKYQTIVSADVDLYSILSVV